MDEWWIWSSPDPVHWKHECTIRPENPYYAQPDSGCWAIDALGRNGKHYFYFLRGPKNIGIMEADTPVAQWCDPLGKAILAEGLVPNPSETDFLKGYRPADHSHAIIPCLLAVEILSIIVKGRRTVMVTNLYRCKSLTRAVTNL